MGMFDNINYETTCPICDNKVSDFQSKDNECCMLNLNPEDVDYFYSSCGKCGCWITFKRECDCSMVRTVRNTIGEEIDHEYTKYFKYSDRNLIDKRLWYQEQIKIYTQKVKEIE